MDNTTSLVVGAGEVGNAIYNVLKGFGVCYIRDKEETETIDSVDVLHICFPQTKGKSFLLSVQQYIDHYMPNYVVIHSTVAFGTTRIIANNNPAIPVFHSPIRGVHPNLEQSLTTFVKFISGDHDLFITRYFKECGIRLHWCEQYEETEAMKLLSTLYYAWNIIYCKEVKKFCDEHDLSFNDVYTIANQTYNSGYSTLGRDEVVRPVLEPVEGTIGGHCLIPNAKLFGDDFFLAKLVTSFNDDYKAEGELDCASMGAERKRPVRHKKRA